MDPLVLQAFGANLEKQAGLGRAAVWTGEVDGKHTGTIASWPLYGELLASLARWSAGEESTLPPGMALTQTLRGGVDRIELRGAVAAVSEPRQQRRQVGQAVDVHRSIRRELLAQA